MITEDSCAWLHPLGPYLFTTCWTIVHLPYLQLSEAFSDHQNLPEDSASQMYWGITNPNEREDPHPVTDGIGV